MSAETMDTLRELATIVSDARTSANWLQDYVMSAAGMGEVPTRPAGYVGRHTMTAQLAPFKGQEPGEGFNLGMW